MTTALETFTVLNMFDDLARADQEYVEATMEALAAKDAELDAEERRNLVKTETYMLNQDTLGKNEAERAAALSRLLEADPTWQQDSTVVDEAKRQLRLQEQRLLVAELRRKRLNRFIDWSTAEKLHTASMLRRTP